MRFVAFLVAAGLINALIAAYLLLRLPASHFPTLIALLVRAAIYAAFGALAGTVGIWFYWRNSQSPFRENPPVPFRLFLLSCTAAWVWVPAFVLFTQQDSPLTLPVALLGAGLLATSVRRVVPSTVGPGLEAWNAEPRDLFAATLATPTREIHGLLAALAIYVAAYDLAHGWIIDAAIMLAACAFIFGWKLTLEPVADAGILLDIGSQTHRAVLRASFVLIPAILLTFVALLMGVQRRNRLEAVAARQTQDNADDPQERTQANAGSSATVISGYQSIILWPPQEKKQIVAPIPQPTPLLAPGHTKPLVIPFDGAYWYFQPPNRGPSPNAHQARGTPLAIDIQAHNFISLIMQAHQKLGVAIPLTHCREIQLGLLNRENRTGILNVAMFLTDGRAPGRPQLYLGQQPVVSSLPDRYTVKSLPVSETIHFSTPQKAKIHQFDEITIMILPDGERNNTGPKVAIEQFALLPR